MNEKSLIDIDRNKRTKVAKMESRMMHQTSIMVTILFACCTVFALAVAAPSTSTSRATTCRRELEHANKTLAKWAESMEQKVTESTLPVSIRESIHAEANNILDLVEEFGQHVGQASISASSLASDLVAIRRRSNRMALDIYLNTFDMRWPQDSLQLGVIVERVQQACLDRAAIQALETPPLPLEALPKHR